MIRTEGLVKRYGDVVALDHLDLEVPKGSVLGLLGPNGAGKTTAVRILTTLLKPDEGSAEVAEIDVRAEPGKVRERIGLSGQNAAVDEYLTGYENLDMVGRLYHLGKKKSQARAAELLERFDLEEAGIVPPRRTREACVVGWTSLPRWSPVPTLSSWTNPRPDSTHAVAPRCGRRSRSWCAVGRPCS